MVQTGDPVPELWIRNERNVDLGDVAWVIGDQMGHVYGTLMSSSASGISDGQWHYIIDNSRLSAVDSARYAAHGGPAADRFAAPERFGTRTRPTTKYIWRIV